MKFICLISILILVSGCDRDPCAGYSTCDEYAARVKQNAVGLNQERQQQINELAKQDWPKAMETRMFYALERQILAENPYLSCRDAQRLLGE